MPSRTLTSRFPGQKVRRSTTVLVTNVPDKQLSADELGRIFSVLPGGVEEVCINRDYSELLKKIAKQGRLVKILEGALTRLIVGENANRRPTHRLPSVKGMPRLPFLGEKVCPSQVSPEARHTAALPRQHRVPPPLADGGDAAVSARVPSLRSLSRNCNDAV